MKALKIYSILFLAICSTTTFGQLGDCTGALLVETKEDLIFTFSSQENQLDDNLTPLCDGSQELFITDADFPTHWFTWTIKESGTLYFTLSMQADEYDLDFILFKSAEGENSCTNKEAIRCMYSGETAGEPSEACIMETGLSPTETDFFEDAGCNFGSNNFLQQLDAIAGEQYKLLVINFSGIEDQNTLFELCGTALLGEDDTPCFTLDTDELMEDNRLSVFPNPSLDQLFISSNNIPTTINFPFTIIDQVGRVIMKKEDNSNLESIETSSLQPGIYFINCYDGGNRKVLKFIKQ